MEDASKDVICIVGPTASGKTALSLHLARLMDAEIVSADSRQVYRYMDIGTAKPTAEERNTAPHHCIDILDPDESFSAGEYGELARGIVADIHARGRPVIVVGGSGLYLRALVDGMFSGDLKDVDLRAYLNRRADEEGLQSLFQRLESIDPGAAERIHPNDRKRIIRALEVYELTGVPMSRMQQERTEIPEFDVTWIGLQWPREILYRRIEDRVDAMVAAGLVDEVRRLEGMGYSRELNSMDSVGYKELFAYLDGDVSLDEAVDAVKRNTRRFAKKQATWFRSNARIRWLPMDDDVDFGTKAEAIGNRL